MPKMMAFCMFLLFATPSFGAELRCDIVRKFVCTASECLPGQITIWNVIDLGAGHLSRCDSKGCDRYEMTASQAGNYINIDVPGRGMLAKLSATGDEYVEIATLGTTTFVSFGACK